MLQATSESAKNGKKTNLKEFPRPYKLPQSALSENVEGGVKIGKTCLPLVSPLCLSKVLERVNHLKTPFSHHWEKGKLQTNEEARP